MSEIPIEIIYPVVAISMGLLGSVTRIYRQYKRDGEWPTTGLDLYVESFLGCMAGMLSWLSISEVDNLKVFAMLGFSAGYSSVDFIETILDGKNS